VEKFSTSEDERSSSSPAGNFPECFKEETPLRSKPELRGVNPHLFKELENGDGYGYKDESNCGVDADKDGWADGADSSPDQQGGAGEERRDCFFAAHSADVHRYYDDGPDAWYALCQSLRVEDSSPPGEKTLKGGGLKNLLLPTNDDQTIVVVSGGNDSFFMWLKDESQTDFPF